MNCLCCEHQIPLSLLLLMRPQQSLQLATIFSRLGSEFLSPFTGNIENCIFDSVSALKIIFCSFMIHKLQKKILQIITLHILHNLAHRPYKGCHIWRKVVSIVPHYGWMLQGPNFSGGKIFWTTPGAHPASYTMGTGSLSQG